MLTPQLKKSLDEKWDKCWPVSDLRPIALLDLISYVFFIKKLDDRNLLHQNFQSVENENFISIKEIKEFRWTNFQKLDEREIHQLFNKKFGIITLMSNYGNSKSLYSDYFKAPLLIEPTPKLIFNTIEIINIIETSDKINQPDIIEYLFGKSKKTVQNGQEFMPGYLSKLMVSLASPSEKDIISDPSAGNGILLIHAQQFIESHINPRHVESTTSFKESNLEGIESDLVLLRLAAMNMVLHGFKDPNLHIAAAENGNLKTNPTLIISALLFSNDPSPVTEKSLKTSILEKEILLLNEILENPNNQARTVVMVNNTLLKSDNPEIIKTRKKIVDHFNLEAIIALPQKNNSIYSGAAILVFDKSQQSSGNVWFWKWENDKKKNQPQNNSDENQSEFDEANEVLNQWKNRKEIRKDSSRNSFFISSDYIKTNNYNLSFNDYKLVRQVLEIDRESENNTKPKGNVIAANKENLDDFFETSTSLPIHKEKRRNAPLIVALIILVVGAGAFYWFYLKGNFNNILKNNKLTNSASKMSGDNGSEDTNTDTAEIISQGSNKITSSNVNHSQHISAAESSSKYIVMNKTWFHSQPDSTTKKPLYLSPRNDLVLTPKEEKNGFVYVVYVNSNGASTHGWLNKKDLKQVE